VRLGMVSTYPPRRCGSAAYTRELGHALAPEFDVVVCAIDRHDLTYPSEVSAVVREDERDDYRRAARVLAEHAVDAVLVHHDEANVYEADLARELGRLGLPYAVALHRIPDLADPSFAAVVSRAERALVFTETAADTVRRQTGRAVDVVPFAVPSVLWHSRRTSGRRGMRERAAIRPRAALTYVLNDSHAGAPGHGPLLACVGSLGRGRELETTLAAMPAVMAARPGARLLIAGRAQLDGKAYRAQIATMLAERGLLDVVDVVDLYLNPVELATLFARTDIVIAPALSADRSWSATMTAAVTAGCPVVARKHPYAEELLATGAGVIIEPGEPGLVAEAVLGLLDAPERLAAARGAALARGRRLTWSAVANRYATILRGVASVAVEPSAPPARLDSVRLPSAGQTEHWARLAVVGAGLARIPCRQSGARLPLSWLDRSVTSLAAAAADTGSAAAVGWALWGLGAIAGRSAVPLTHEAEAGLPQQLRERARALREMVATLPTSSGLGTAAYAVLGLASDPADPAAATALHRAAVRLDEAWTRAAWRGPAWPWFGDRLGDDGGPRLPQAMIVAGRRLGDEGMLHRGLVSLDWYARRAGLASGSMRLPAAVAEYAADAGALVEALVEAYVAVGAAHYARLAANAFSWFHGGNRYATHVYDAALGSATAVLRSVDAGRRDSDGTLAYLGAFVRLAGAGLLRPQEADFPRRDLAAA
jgi:glycosyltransferase involved in cell wall biosynthesis